MIKERCFICGNSYKYYLTGEDFYAHTTNKKFDVYKCNYCGVERIFPVPTHDEIIDFYPKNYYSFNILNAKKNGLNTFFEQILYKIYHKRLCIVKWILKRRKMGVPYQKIGKGYFLDIGCGDGYILSILKQLGRETYGFEMGEKKKTSNIHYDTDITKVDFGKTKFDFIRIAHVFEHISNPIQFLQKVRSLLQPTGIAEFTLPNTGSFDAKVFGKYRSNRDIPRHLINYNINNLSLLLKSQGFKILKKRHVLGFGTCGSLKYLLKYKYKKNGRWLDNVIVSFILLLFDFVLSIFKSGDHMGFRVTTDTYHHNR